jgi:putative peptidoglycan lipid II flippase
MRMALLSAGTLLSRILGMLRETLMASAFTQAETDAFMVAWRVPNALRALLAEGALSAAFLPLFSSVLARGNTALTQTVGSRPSPTEKSDEHRDELREVVSYIRGASLAILIPISVLGVVFARPLLRVLAGDFGGDSQRFDLSAGMLRVLFPYIFFMGASAVGIATLQTLGRFGALAFAPALLNVAFLIAPFLFAPLCVAMGLHPIYAMALGALLGGALQLVALMPSLSREQMLPRPRVLFSHPAVKRAGMLLAPSLAGLAIYQVDIVLSNHFLASMPEGSVTAFSFAQRIADIPQGVFITAIAGSFLPELSRAASEGNRSQTSEKLGDMLSIATFVAIPVAVILGTYAEAIVPIVYGYGKFQAGGSARIFEVVRSLRWQAANVALLSLVRPLIAIYHAAQAPKVPVMVSALDLLAYIALAFALRAPMGHSGIAAAIMGSTAIQLVLLLFPLRRYADMPWSRVLGTLARVGLAAGLTGLLARFMVTIVPWSEFTLRARFLCIAGGIALGTVYLLTAWALGIQELQILLAKIRHKLQRRRR